MGLFSFIGSIGSSIASGISKIGSAIATGVTSFAKTAFKAATGFISSLTSSGGFIGKIATGALKLFGGVSKIIAGPLGPIVGQIIVHLIIKAISKVVEWLAQKNEVIAPEDKVEEVGYRVEEAAKHDDWQKREEFDSFKDYHEYLKNKIPAADIDRNKLRENHLAYVGLGITTLTEALEEKLGLQIPLEFLIEIGRCKLSGTEINSLLEEFGAKGYNLSLFREYLQGKLTVDMNKAIEAAVLESLKKIYPEKSDEDLVSKISSMKNSSRNDVAVLKNYETEIQTLIDKPNDAPQILSGEVAKNDRLE